MGTKLLLGFGGTVIQVVVHPKTLQPFSTEGFGGTVIQVVVHPQSKYQQLWHQFRRHRKSSSSSPLQVTRPSGPVFRKYGKPSSSSPKNSDQSLVTQSRRYHKSSSSSPLQISAGRSIRFGGTVNQAVVHPCRPWRASAPCFGSTANQAVVHRLLAAKAKELVSEVR